MKKMVIALAIISVLFQFQLQLHCDTKQEVLHIPEELKVKIFKNPIHTHLWSIYSQKKSPQQSFEMLTKLIKKNRYAYKWLIDLLYKTGNLYRIEQLIPAIQKSFPDLLKNDPGTGFKIAHAIIKKVMLATKQIPKPIYNQAMDILIPLNKKFPDHQKIATLTATLYDLNNDPRNAINVAKKYLNVSAELPTNFVEYFKNAGRYLKLIAGQKDKKIIDKKLRKALDNLQKSIDLQPQFPNSWILSAVIKEKLNMIDSAIKDCKKALELTGPNKKVVQILLTLFFKQKKLHNKQNMFKIDAACFNQALTLIKEKKYDAALELLNKCTAKPPKEDGKTKVLKIHVISNEKQETDIKIEFSCVQDCPFFAQSAL